MREGKPDEAGPYLAKSDKPDARQLGESLQSTATDLQKAEALRSMANGLNGNDKTAFLTAARDYYERVLQAQPDGPDTLKIKLILGQISDGLPKKEGLPAGVFALFDQSTKDKIYKLYLEKGVGVGTVALDAKTRFSSSHSLRVTPDYRNINVVPNWKLPIVENPQIGQYRYVAFAWKKEGGTKIGIGFRFADGTWQPYSAGADLPNHLSVSKEIPSDWSIVVRDLFRDRGPCEIVGTGLGAYDGVAAFADNVYLGRTEADVRKAASRRRRE